MVEEEYGKFTDVMARFIAYSAKHLPDDVADRLAQMRAEEDSPMAKAFYDAMDQNLRLADELDRPCCQDTGVLQFYVRAGTRFPLLDGLSDCLVQAVKLATAAAPLRHNVVEVFDEKNTGNNVGTRIPWIEWEPVPGSDSAEICLYMAGGGCSLPGAAKVLPPIGGYENAVEFVFDRIATLGVNACPPLLVGVGFGGSADVAAKLSKLALLRPVGSRNPNPRAAQLEEMLETGLNGLGIGPGGVTGKRSVMGVNIEQAGRHTATLAVGLSTACWSHRRSRIRFGPDLRYEILSFRGAVL